MRRALIVGMLAAAVAGCATQAAHERAERLAPGMTTVQASAVLGAPVRTATDDGREAWQYCWPGMVSDDYLVAWFEDSLLTGWALEPSFNFGTCAEQMEWLRWPEDQESEAEETSESS